MVDHAAGERFDHFMERWLYGPDGFYRNEGTAGRRTGDFLTSPEVGPLFGAVLAEAIDRWWEELGRPDPLRVYDVGCGPGVLLQSIGLARPDRPWELIGVDRMATAGADIHELPDDLSGSIVMANELLDNLPFRIVERRPDGCVELTVAGGLEVWAPIGAALEIDLDRDLGLAVGTRAPIMEAARRWVASVMARRPARLCLFDYGAPTTAELATRGGWLRTYTKHERGHDPLADPGRRDITTDVAWDQLPAPDLLQTQADFLRSWGIERLVDEGRRYWREHADAPDLTAIRMRSRVTEAEALLDPDGLGRWWAATWIFDAAHSRLG